MNKISIKCLKSEKIESGACHGQFLINSLQTGQGITIGNQLRRVLLGDLGGIAISAVRIAGITHEFSTIPGVREDILEILLNLKGIVFKPKRVNGRNAVPNPEGIVNSEAERRVNIVNSDRPKQSADSRPKRSADSRRDSEQQSGTDSRVNASEQQSAVLPKQSAVLSQTKKTQVGRLKIQGPSVLTADLIQLPSDLEIVNPNHYIATISTSNILEIELKFEYGTGYKLASQSFSEEDENYLQLDTVFMPVQKVDFKIENRYDTNNNISEKLLLDIWTNGSISPKDALESAAQIIIDLFGLLLNNKETNENNQFNPKSQSISIEPYTNIAIEELQLSVRAYNCLKKAQINTVGDLLQYSPEKLQELKNFGRKSADEVFSTLKTKLGIILK